MNDLRSSSVKRINLILDILPDDQTASRETLASALREYSGTDDTYYRRVTGKDLSDDLFAEKLIDEFGGKVIDGTLVNTGMRTNIALFWFAGNDSVRFEQIEGLIAGLRRINSEYDDKWSYFLFTVAKIENTRAKEDLRRLKNALDARIFTGVVCENRFMSGMRQIEAAVIFLYTLSRDSIQSIFPDTGYISAFHFMYTQRYRPPRLDKNGSESDNDQLIKKTYNSVKWWKDVRSFTDSLADSDEVARDFRSSLSRGDFDTDCIPIPKKLNGFRGLFSGKDNNLDEFLTSVSVSVSAFLSEWCDKEAAAIVAKNVDTARFKTWYYGVLDEKVRTPFEGVGRGKTLWGGMTVSDLAELSSADPGSDKIVEAQALVGYFSSIRAGGDLRKKIRERIENVLDDSDVRRWFKSLLYEKMVSCLRAAVMSGETDWKELEKRIIARSERGRTDARITNYVTEEEFVRKVDESSDECSLDKNIPYNLKPTLIEKNILKLYYCDVSAPGAPCGRMVSAFFRRMPSYVDSRLDREKCLGVCVSIFSCRRDIFDA